MPMTDNELMKDVMSFVAAMNEAEENDENTFTCPICGGEATWGRCSYNGHHHAKCSGCGFSMVE